MNNHMKKKKNEWDKKIITKTKKKNYDKTIITKAFLKDQELVTIGIVAGFLDLDLLK